MRLKRFEKYSVLVLSFIVGTAIVYAQEQTDKPKAGQLGMLTAKVLVLDPDGNPVEGATVFPSGLRTKVERGSHWGWRPELHGPIPKIETNSDGFAEMPCPKYVIEKLETGTVTWSVEHPDFVDFREDRGVDDDPAEIKLERGFRIAATAVDGETGEKIRDDLYAVIAGGSSKDWKLHDNGMLVSPVFSKQQSALRLVQLVDGKPALFSEMIDVAPEDRSRVLLKDVTLTKGVRLEGLLDSAVSRPVKNGYVTAGIMNKSAGDDWKNIWFWYDRQPVAADGTFVFESLPADEVLQLFPICDGWVPARPDKETVLKFFPLEVVALNSSRSIPQLLELKGTTVSATLKLDQATSVRVFVKDPDGKPLPGAEVFMGPNQRWFDGGSQILGDYYPSRDALVRTRAGNFEFEYNRENRFQAKTDEEGIAVIDNLPSGKTESILVGHDDFEMPISGRDRQTTVELKSGQIAEVTVQMQNKGTDMLGEAEMDDNEKEKDESEPDADSETKDK